MSVLKHLKTFQHVSIFLDHLQGTRRFLVKVTEFKVIKIEKKFYNFENFKFSDSNKEPTSSLKMIWRDRNMLKRF